MITIQFVIKERLQAVQVQFTTRSSTRVQKTEVKIHLPGRAVQNTEIEDRVSSLCVVKL
jgi:hypothetical protein